MTIPPALGLSTYRWNNNLKSILLMAAFPCLLMGLVAVFFYYAGSWNVRSDGFVHPELVKDFLGSGVSALTPHDFMVEACFLFVPIVFAFALLWLFVGSLFNDSMIRMATQSIPVERSEHPELYNSLENLCISCGIRMPALYLMDLPLKNAFASGMGPSSFSITVTRGLLDSLTKDEVEAVLAHELTHIINRDVRLLVITTLFTGMLAFFSEMVWRSMQYSGFEGGTRRGGAARLPMLFLAGLVLVAGLIIATLFRLALSRNREYLADAGAVELTKRPESLIRALGKIAGYSDVSHLPSGVQAMMIDNPPSFLSLFDTHPPIQDRIDILRSLAGLPDEGESIIPSVNEG
ncbi:MAG: M48 family metallopeptidase [Alphaproteobacteria bacterium]|nr:M48 family metallopeptidase [Alphaproteobacteria bacterium]